MEKIISLFKRNYDTDHLVRDEVVQGAEWVIAGEGVATRKYDGVCTMIRDHLLYKRYSATAENARAGKVPSGWEPADGIDLTTGKQAGWLPVGDGPEDKSLRVALANTTSFGVAKDGTYEFLGPKSQGNVESKTQHILLAHMDAANLEGVPRDFEGLKAYLAEHDDIEGIVWHHPDGRMVKIKGKDFGIKRVPAQCDEA